MQSTEDMFQTVYITMQDGTQHQFSGPATVQEGQTIQLIQFSEPQSLPHGSTWGNLSE